MSTRPGSVGPYRILDTIGVGGMGVVYRGENAATGRLAAVKTVRVPMRAQLSGLRREIHALTRLSHPGIVRVLDEGIHDGLPWYAMELLEGVSLRDYVPGRRATGGGADAATNPTTLTGDPAGGAAAEPSTAAPPGHTIETALTLVRRLCAPLAYLHGQGIVHRDLKPENVLVVDGERPVIVDFGIAARFAGVESREALDVTPRMAGTMAYMAPEQIEAALVDARADLYALGCILYELVCGHPPFTGNAAQIALSHLTRTPVPLSESVDAATPELDALVARLLAKRPSDRFGYADDVAAVLADLGAAAEPAAGPRPSPYLYRPRFAGRGAALASLDARLSALKMGGGLVAVGGESGVGKTRFAVEVTRLAPDRGVLVLTGECPPGSSEPGSGGVAPLEALKGPLEAIADRCREHGAIETHRLLGPRGKLLARYEPALAGLPGQDRYPEPADLPPDGARVRLFTYLAATFGALAEAKPVLLVCDDLQWADELSLGFFVWLMQARQLEAMPMLVVGLYRSEEVGERLSRVLDAPGVSRLDIGRLDEPDVAAIVADMLAIAPPPAGLSAFLSRQSEGNPFFVAEYLHAAVEAGLLTRAASGTWRVAEPSASAGETDFERLSLPVSLRELVGRRLADLPPTMAALVSAAAVAGRESDVRVAARVAGLDGADLMDAVNELVRRHILEESRPGRLRFCHDKIREHAYASLDAAARRGLHRAAAGALEALGDAGRDAAPALLGMHWQEAGERSRARACYLAGARAAKAGFAHAEAERLLRAYLDLVDEPTNESIDARNTLGYNNLHLRGRSAEAVDELLHAIDDARQIGSVRGEVHSLKNLGIVYRETARVAEAREIFERGLAMARAAGDPTEAAQLLANLAIVLHDQSYPDEARALYLEALQIYRETGNRRFEGITLGNLASLAVHTTSDLAEVERLFKEAIAIHREVGNRNSEGLALGNLSVLYFTQGRLEEFREHSEQSIAIHHETGNRRFEGIVIGNLGEYYIVRGQPDQARAWFRRALPIVRECGDRLAEANLLFSLARLDGDEGRVEEAREQFDRGLAVHRELGNRRYEGVGATLKAALERRSGRYDEAERLLERAETVFRDVGDRVNLGLCLCQRGHLALARGTEARTLLDEARATADEVGYEPDGDLGNALARLERAVTAFERGDRLFEGEALGDVSHFASARSDGRTSAHDEEGT